MARFEKVSKYKDVEFNLPVRKTVNSAGYDFEVAEDITIPAYSTLKRQMENHSAKLPRIVRLADMGRFTKETDARPTLVPTGVKCYLEEGYYLELSMRSSSPLKYWLVCANSVGIIDADYADNPDNEGHIYFQVINFGPTPIKLKKGDIIGQGIIKKYEITDDDAAKGERQGGFGSTTK